MFFLYAENESDIVKQMHLPSTGRDLGMGHGDAPA